MVWIGLPGRVLCQAVYPRHARIVSPFAQLSIYTRVALLLASMTFLSPYAIIATQGGPGWRPVLQVPAGEELNYDLSYP